MSHANTPATPADQQPPVSEKSQKVKPVEYLLVATIASVVGVMAVPDLTPDVGSMEGYAQLAQLQYKIDSYRTTLEDYRADHHVYPGYGYGQAGVWLHGELSDLNYRRQLLLWSDEWGHVGQLDPGRKELGPYLERGLLVNPVNGLDTVTLVRDNQAFPVEANNMSGWYFKPQTGELRANCTGESTFTGQSYYQL